MDSAPARPPVSVLLLSADRRTAANLAAVFREHGFAARVADARTDVADAAPDVLVFDAALSPSGSWTGSKRPFLIALGATAGAIEPDLRLDAAVEPAVLLGVVKRFRRALAPCV
jgi:hypothetical protein